MPGSPTLILNMRLPVDLKQAVEAAVRQNQDRHEGPQSLTKAVTEALLAWLDARGTPLPAESVEAVANVRPVGRPKKPYALPEGTDAVALWNEFWTMAYTVGWSKAVSWAERTHGTDIDSWDQAVRAALPEDRRPTREELGLPSEKEWIDAQVAGIMQPRPGKKAAADAEAARVASVYNKLLGTEGT